MSNFDFVEKVMCIGGNGTPDLQFYKRGFNLGGTGSQPSWQDIILSGNTALTLTNALANGLNYLKLFGGTEQRNLPSGYKQVEYLQSSGTQYIDTGVNDITNSEFEVVAQQTSITGAFPTIMGALDADSNYKVVCGLSTSNNTFYSQCGGSQGFIVSSVPNDTQKHTFKVTTTTNQQTLQVDDTAVVIGNYAITSTTGYSLTICARNKATVSNFTNQKVFSVRIKKSGTLIRNLIPARRNSDNVLGMYDTVTGNFLTNAGTGDFTAGADVVPSPTNPMDIVCNNGVVKVSKNLYNPATRTDGYYIGADGVIAQGSGTFCYSALIPVKPNTDYMLSGIAGQSDIRRLHAYDSNGNWISQISFANTTTGNTYNITGTTPNNCVYVRISIPKLDTNVQVEQGTTATTYMSYGTIYTDGTQEVVGDSLGNTASAQMLLSVGDYKDTQEVLSGSVTRNVGIKVLDGTENWTVSGTGTTSNPIRFAVSGIIMFPDSNTIECLNTHYPFSGVAPTGESIALGTFNVGIYNNVHYVRFAPTDITTVADWTDYLKAQYNAGTPVIIVYPLATATTETVTGQSLTTQAGTNIVEITQASIDNLELEVSYKGTI